MPTTQERLDTLKNVCATCTNCTLYGTRNQLVFGEGSITPKILCIGEAPGKTENAQGRPFIGRSGQLLRKLLTAIELNIDIDIYIANILKCWPPANRMPNPEEITSCIKFLQKQIEILQPKLLLLLGKTAVKGIIPEFKDLSVNLLRANSKAGLYSYMGTPILVTYHPSALLMDPAKKVLVKEDFVYLKEIIKENHHEYIQVPSKRTD